MTRPFAFVALIAFLACVAQVRAALEFEAESIHLKPALGETRISASFAFKNTGLSPVGITAVRSGCGCTVPEKPSEPIAPGATGAIPVVFKADGRQGPQSQTIEVETSDGAVHQLRLQIDLPVRVSFAPRLLLFRGAGTDPQNATLRFHPDAKPELLGVTSQNPAFEVVGEPAINEAGELTIAVRHRGAEASSGAPTDSARGSLRIRTRDAEGREHIDVLYVRHLP